MKSEELEAANKTLQYCEQENKILKNQIANLEYEIDVLEAKEELSSLPSETDEELEEKIIEFGNDFLSPKEKLESRFAVYHEMSVVINRLRVERDEFKKKNEIIEEEKKVLKKKNQNLIFINEELNCDLQDVTFKLNNLSIKNKNYNTPLAPLEIDYQNLKLNMGQKQNNYRYNTPLAPLYQNLNFNNDNDFKMISKDKIKKQDEILSKLKGINVKCNDINVCFQGKVCVYSVLNDDGTKIIKCGWQGGAQKTKKENHLLKHKNKLQGAECCDGKGKTLKMKCYKCAEIVEKGANIWSRHECY